MRAISIRPGSAAVWALCLVASACSGGEVAAEGGERSGFVRRPAPGATAPALEAEARSQEPEQELPPPEAESAVERSVEPEPASPLPSAPAAEPALAARAELERRGYAQLESGESAAAAATFSRLLLEELSRPGGAERGALVRWTEAMEEAQARHRWHAQGDWTSIEAHVRPGDSLIALRQRVLEEHPNLLICTGLIARVNQLRSERSIRPDDTLRVPTDRASVLVDLSERWALYLLGGEVAASWEVGVGQDGTETTPGVYTIGNKQTEPPWFPEGRDMVPFGDPENPLGTRWLAWNDENGRSTSLGFHGTNDESGVGKPVSRGCIRMRNTDVEALFDILPRGATVVVQP